MVLGILAGLLFIAIALIYFVEPASRLPVFFPGYNRSLLHHHHAKHGVLFVILAIFSFIFAWFKSGKVSDDKKQN